MLLLTLLLLILFYLSEVLVVGEPASDRRNLQEGPQSSLTSSLGRPVDAPLTSALHIWLREVSKSRHVTFMPKVVFDLIWPEPGDPGWRPEIWDAFETPRALRNLSDYHRPRGALAKAAEEGFLGAASPPATPEEALTSLFAEWVDSEASYHQSLTEFQESVLSPGESWDTISDARRGELMSLPEMPIQDLGELKWTAEAILERWPRHPIGDHARLALVRAAIPKGGVPNETAIADHLASIGSSSIRAQAALYVTRFPMEPLHDSMKSLLSEMEEVDGLSPEAELAISTWAMNRALRMQDWPSVAWWSDRLRAELAEACSGSHSNDGELGCEQRAYELRDVAARLVALGLWSPSTWEEAVTAEAWRCHLRKPHHGMARGVATWRPVAGWTFGAWDRSTDVTACLEGTKHTLLEPPAATDVRITLESDQ